MLVQVCVLYAVVGLTKVQGTAWRDGTAIYYAFRTAEFSWPGLSEIVYSSPIVVTILSYATVAVQVSFPFCVTLNAHSRHVILLLAIAFHLGTGAFMGLVTFASFMIAADLLFIPDQDYQRWGRYLTRLRMRCTELYRRRLQTEEPELRGAGRFLHRTAKRARSRDDLSRRMRLGENRNESPFGGRSRDGSLKSYSTKEHTSVIR